MNINYLAIYTSCDAGAVTTSSSKYDVYVVNSYRCNIRRSELTGSTAYTVSIGDQLATASGKSDAMSVCDCGFSEPSLI